MNGKWTFIKDAPIPRDGGTYLVTDGMHVAPYIRGVIHNNVGTCCDWRYGEAIIAWMHLPEPPFAGPEPYSHDLPKELSNACLSSHRQRCRHRSFPPRL